ncbi:unnamed protein product [Xylocopa violacea]|uniref:GATA-type domain-containing protein n=1 Tax=Xylocopa violacea TaxID=135666 RepID=A0ABP1N9G6_XYLVO
MSPFMRYFILEDYPNIAPNSYNVLESFKAIKTKPCSHSISKKGYSGIARFSKKPILKNHYPSPSDYSAFIFPKEVQKLKYPFKSNNKKQILVGNTVPGRNTDLCKICGKKPFGDYWHIKNEIFLCRSCMNKEFETEHKYRRRELKQFHKIRDCSILHQHGTTTAKMWLMHPTLVAEWIRREAYLSSYFNV